MDNDVVKTLVFFVNGKKVTDENVDPEFTLLQYLRLKLRLCGTKLGCGEGGCGACTVMVSRFDRMSNTVQHLAVNACLTPVCSVHGQAVTTVEGIGSTKTRLHPVQERIAKAHGSQCGFCTPGIVMSMYALLRSSPSLPTMDDIETSFQGNLCRCTGYRPILEGYKTLSKEFGCMGPQANGQCCQMTNGYSNGSTMNGTVNGFSNGISNGTSNGYCNINDHDIHPPKEGLFTSSDFLPFDPTQEPIFPPELKLSDEYDTQNLIFESKRVRWFRPTQLNRLIELKAEFPKAKIVVGNTEVGVEVKFKNFLYPVIVSPTGVDEMHRIYWTDDGVTLGVANTLSTLEKTLRKSIETEQSYKTRIFVGIVNILHWFAGKQIRNVAAISGNIMTASPISDLNPLFLASNCRLTVISQSGKRMVTMDHSFFTGYRTTVIRPDEIVLSITIPYSRKDEYFIGYKQARRRDDDIAIVNAGLRVLFRPKTNVIEQLGLAFGGMAPITKMATETMNSLIGRQWDDNLLDDACLFLAKDLPLSPDAPGSMIEFRRSLTTSFFFKFYLDVLQKLQQSNIKDLKSKVPKECQSAIKPFHKDPIKSSQLYQVVADGQRSKDPVGRPVVHMSAYKQATGEAVYCDDLPHFENELYMAVVSSSRSHAKIVSIDASEALKMDGVIAFYCHKDITKEQNTIGPILHDEQVFASDKVTAHGQAIGVIVAIDQTTAQAAARRVNVQYDNLQPVILSIEDAIKFDTISHQFDKTIISGNLEEGFTESDHILEGQFKMGGQEHFYLETQCAIAVPKNEDGEMEIFASSQNPTETQMEVAHVLGVPANRIVCRVKRMGGGFGGKETRSHIVALPCAIAADKLGRPVRCMLDRDEDMVRSGTRHPFFGKYRVGFQKSGHLKALDIKVYSNAGYSIDLTPPVTERAIFHVDNCYRIANMKSSGFVCLTNISSNTAFRGFGGPQGMLISENWVEDVATVLKMDPVKFRDLNLYEEGDLTHFNQPLINCTIRRCWEQCLRMSDYWKRRRTVDNFNEKNRWKKRGLSTIPTKFGIAFTLPFMNQAGALVHIYTDGSVLLTHGGTEMGQGLHTKMIQVASRALDIPTDLIHISETSTDKVPNTSATAASVGSDINGMAVLDACRKLKERLVPFVAACPKGSWNDWVKSAYLDRVSLSATGFYKTPDIGYDWKTNTGNPFNYFTYGAACSEVEIDCLTGDHQVIRTDIVMDVGDSLNPAIDIGQIEGGFIQGYGLFVLEESRHSLDGFLYTRGPGMYKIPSFNDIPGEFNVALLKGASNPRAVYSSKAVGEPPLFLAASVFFAIKDAIRSARSDEGLEGIFQLDSPATSERIRMACSDRFTKQFPSADPATYKAWSLVA